MQTLPRELFGEIADHLVDGFPISQINQSFRDHLLKHIKPANNRIDFEKWFKDGKVLNIVRSRHLWLKRWRSKCFEKACLGGHFSTFHLGLRLIDNKKYDGLNNAYMGGHTHIIDYLEEMGEIATNCASIFSNGKIEIIEKNKHIALQNIQNAYQGVLMSGNLAAFDLVESWITGLYYPCPDSFYYAALGENLDIVNILISRGCNDWESLLDGACAIKNKQLIDLAISKGACNYQKALGYACASWDLDTVRYLHSLCENDHQYFVNDDNLNVAIMSGNLDLVTYVADFDRGDGPIHEACIIRDFRIIEFLLKKIYTGKRYQEAIFAIEEYARDDPIFREFLSSIK